MSSSAYHHGHLRQALVDAAEVAVRDGGPSALSIRDLARRVGVSHNAAYRHFAHRDDLVTEVSLQAMGRLLDTMERRLARIRTRDPVLRARQRLAEVGRGYVEYALAEPGLFSLAFSSTSALSQAGDSADRDPYALLGRVLDDLVQVGFLAPDARAGAEIVCWSGVHGFSELCVSGALGATTADDRDVALDRVLVAIDRSFAATSGAVADPEDLRL